MEGISVEVQPPRRYALPESDDESSVEVVVGDTFVLVEREDKRRDHTKVKRYETVLNKFPISFYDYANPVAGWYTRVKGAHGAEVAGKRIMAALKAPNLVLATVPGARLDPRKLNAIKGTVGSMTNGSPPPVEFHQGSEWAWIACPTPAIAEVLLTEKIVWNPALRAFIVFRKPRAVPYACVALAIRGLQNKVQWLQAINLLVADGKDSGLTVVHTSPPQWTDNYTERVIWIVRTTTPGYAYPAQLRVKSARGQGRVPIEVSAAPRCMICAGEDHHQATCDYAAYAAKARKYKDQ
jgi:hypothetical protein